MTALDRVARAAAAATAALDDVSRGIAHHGDPEPAREAASALELPGEGTLAAVAARSDGAPEAVVLLLSLEGAHRLAAVLMGAAPDAPVAGGPLTELEHAAVGDATDKVLAAAGEAMGAALGDARLGPASAGELAQVAGSGAQAIAADLRICGEAGRLVLLTAVPAASARPAPDVGPEGDMRESLRTTTVRLSAEVGRARLPVERLVEVPPGDVIELDRDADDPIDLYVNGRRFALGRLELTDAGEWAVRVERVLDPAEVEG